MVTVPCAGAAEGPPILCSVLSSHGKENTEGLEHVQGKNGAGKGVGKSVL